MFLIPKRASIAALSSLCLSACGSFPQPVVQTPSLPPESFECSNAPMITGEVVGTDRGFASYVLMLYEAWADCSGQLALVGKALN